MKDLTLDEINEVTGGRGECKCSASWQLRDAPSELHCYQLCCVIDQQSSYYRFLNGRLKSCNR